MTTTKTEKKALETMAGFGFTFAGDSIFRSWRSGERALTSLVRRGLVERCEEDGGVCYRLLPEGRSELVLLAPRKPEPSIS